MSCVGAQLLHPAIGASSKLIANLPISSAPVEWGQGSLSVIARRSPVDGRWYGFMGRTLMFGDIAAVLNYNVFHV